MSDQPSSTQAYSKVPPNVSNSSLATKTSNVNTPKSKVSEITPKMSSQISFVPDPHQSVSKYMLDEPLFNNSLLDDSSVHLVNMGRSTSDLAISGSQLNLNTKEPTPSIASDVSHPGASQELHQRIKELQK